MFDKKVLERVMTIPDTLENDLKELKTVQNEISTLKIDTHKHTNSDALNMITVEKIQQWDAGGGGGALGPETGHIDHTHNNLGVLNQILPAHIVSLTNLQSNLDTKAEKEHKHTEYVSVELGKQLSTNDFNDQYKAKLDKLNTFDGSYNTLTDTPDLSQYTNTETVNQLIDAKIQAQGGVDLSGYVKNDQYQIDMANKASKTHFHDNYRLTTESHSKTEIEELLAGKANSTHVHGEYVKSEVGKGLSTNDFTSQYKLALDGLIAGSGQVQSIEATKVIQDPSHKFVTDAQINEWTGKATTNYVDSKTQEVSSTLNSYVSTQLGNLDNLYVRKVGGKDLSTNDFTTLEKNKLAGIANNANNYVHPPNHNASEVSVTGGKSLQQAIDDGDIGGNNGSSGLIFDANSEKTGNGQLVSDTYADTGRAIALTSSLSSVIAYFKTDKIKLGKYGIALRAKISTNASPDNIVKIEINKVTAGGSELLLKTINFTGTDFESIGSYCWLTSYFEYNSSKDSGDKIGVKVSINNPGGSITVTIDYIQIMPLMAAQFVMG